MARAVLLNSGGIDSRVSAAMMKESGLEIYSLYINWHHEAEEAINKASKETADMYAVSHEIFPWAVDWSTWIPATNKYAVPYPVVTSIVLGSQYSFHIDADYVVSGVRNDLYGKDKSIIDAATTIINMSKIHGDSKRIFSAPVYNFTDDEVTLKAKELGVSLDTTQSCNKSPHCGVCYSCLRRIRQGIALP